MLGLAGDAGSDVRALVQVRQVARVLLVDSTALDDLRVDGRLVLAAGLGQELLLGFALEKLLHGLLRVDALQLAVVLQNVGGNLRGDALLDGTLVLRSDR